MTPSVDGLNTDAHAAAHAAFDAALDADVHSTPGTAAALAAASDALHAVHVTLNAAEAKK